MTKSALVAAVNAEEITTQNGMPTYKSSLDSCVDLFFHGASMRGGDITGLFSKAYAEEPELATRLSLWLRDVRGGAGERKLFRDTFRFIIGKDVEFGRRVLARIPEVGRWDDVLVCFGTALERDALSMINHALRSGDGLCAKWMPRKGDKANKIRAYMQSSPKVYRKLLVTLSDTVEQKMCSGNWDGINYSHVPSLAAARYQKAFLKNDPVGYATYKADLEKGVDKDGKEVKINAGAVYPYDIVKSIRRGDCGVADKQWASLPDYLNGSDENILPMIDTSASMTWFNVANGIDGLDVALSLGLYVSERSRGLFQDVVLNFTTQPQMHTVKGSLSDRLSQLRHMSVGGSTNIEAAFDLILKAAVKHNVPESEMPTQILIFSDMQFNLCVREPNLKAYEMFQKQYADAGYKLPKIVFWNLNGKIGGSPVTANQRGTALVSGFSPAIMAQVLGADPDDFTPRAVMLKTLSNSRYDF